MTLPLMNYHLKVKEVIEVLFYDEIFCSIQGESSDSGLPCIFIRLYGCPVGCSYCDQPQKADQKKRISVENIINKVLKFKGVRNICITGGEPLIHKEVLPLTWELMSMDYKVSIETSGCVPIEDHGYRRSYKYVMDIKCPSSGVAHKNIFENLLRLQSNDEVKYVIANREDYEYMKMVLKKYPTSASILVSPMFDKDHKAVIGKELVDWILEDRLNVRVQIQLHKILGVL